MGRQGCGAAQDKHTGAVEEGPNWSALCFYSWTLPLPAKSGTERTSSSLQMMAKNWAPLGWARIIKWRWKLCCVSQMTFMCPILKCVTFPGWVPVVEGSQEFRPGWSLFLQFSSVWPWPSFLTSSVLGFPSVIREPNSFRTIAVENKACVLVF